MALILAIETSTLNCSVALCESGQAIATTSFVSEKYSHAEKLSPLIDECLAKAGKTFSHLQAIAISKGPGSYTGLRIGVSTAKGLCYGLNIPLIAMDSTEVLCEAAWKKYPSIENCVVLLDARRMEVYTAHYSRTSGRKSETSAMIVDADSFSELSGQGVVFIGDAADKCAEVVSDELWQFSQEFPAAEEMASVLEQKFSKGDFEDVAYFEPYYLKDFIAGTPKDLLGQG